MLLISTPALAVPSRPSTAVIKLNEALSRSNNSYLGFASNADKLKLINNICSLENKGVRIADIQALNEQVTYTTSNPEETREYLEESVKVATTYVCPR